MPQNPYRAVPVQSKLRSHMIPGQSTVSKTEHNLVQQDSPNARSDIIVHQTQSQPHPVSSSPAALKPKTVRAPNKTKSDILLDDKSAKIDVHSKNIRLFPHQQALTAKMLQLESMSGNEPFVGVLKDPPGSGKSFALLALMLHEKRQYGKTQNLLVIPHNIHKQWLKYIEDFSEELQAVSLMYYGDVTSLFYDARVLFAYDIIITTSTFYDMVTSTVASIGVFFNRVILDEIDSIAFFTQWNKIPASSIWLVSASADLTKRGVYAEHVRSNGIMCDPLFIKRSINLPPPIVQHHTCFNEYVQILQSVLTKDELSYVYAVDFSPFKFSYLRNKDAISDPKQLLCAKFQDTCYGYRSTVQSIRLLEEGSKYRPDLPQFLAQKIDIRDRFKVTIDRIISLTDKKMCALCCNNYTASQTDLESVNYESHNCTKAVDDPESHNCTKTEDDPKSQNDFDSQSSNCNEHSPVDDKVKKQGRKHCTTNCCKTTFCVSCIHEWISKDPFCPVCLETIDENSTTVNEHLPSDDTNDAKLVLKDKIERFEEILSDEVSKVDFRILIFSEMTGSFLNIRNILNKKGLGFSEIEGNQYTMDKAIIDYKTGKRPVLLVDAQSYGAGMNMEMTTCVVILHKTERETQIIGRAQRLGRSTPLKVHHLVYPNE